MRQTRPDPKLTRKLIFGLAPIIILLAFPITVFAPEYLSPGVFIEEKNSSPKPIEGVTTPTAGQTNPTGSFDRSSPYTLHIGSDVECTAAPTMTCKFGPTSENYVNLFPQQFEVVSPDGNTNGHASLTLPAQPLPTLGGNDLLNTPAFDTGKGNQLWGDYFDYSLNDDTKGSGGCTYSQNPEGSLVIKVFEIGTSSFDELDTPSFDEFVPSISTYPGDYDTFMVIPNEGPPASGSIMNQLENNLNRDVGSDQLPNMEIFSDGFESGDTSVWSSGSSMNEQRDPTPWLDKVLDRINPFPSAIAAKKPAKKILKIRVRVPVSKGYVSKFKVKPKYKNPHDPARYVDPTLLPFVTRKWVVGDMLYVAINISVHRQYAKDAK